MKKLKLSFNNFPVKIFEQGFNWRFSAKFSTFKKKIQFTRSWSKMPLFRYLSATILEPNSPIDIDYLFDTCDTIRNIISFSILKSITLRDKISYPQ